ncbi:MAG: type II CAAX endopeptidase family protein [Thermoanaerobaculia bacterium]
MSPYVLPLVFAALVWIAVIVLNERGGLLSIDRFASPTIKILAYLWLGGLLFLLVALVTGSSLHTPTAKQLSVTPFYQLFLLHAILIVFLIGWWLLTQMPPIGEFLNIRRQDAGEAVMTGFAVGFGGWIFTLGVALLIGLLLTAAGLIPKNPQPSPMIGWMAALPLWKKILIVLSAMTVEEAFFRGWLQKRIGLIASTVLFALAHSGLGQPLLLIGVAVISLIIGFTFYRTRNLIPGVIAHGVFDAVQLFVIIPVVFKMTGMGS